MTLNLLIDAFTQTISEAVQRSSDGIVRVDIGAEVPLAETLLSLSQQMPDSIIGLLDSYREKDLLRSGVSFEMNARKLTQLRNDRSRRHPVIYIGAANGVGQQGLKDVAIVVRLVDLKRKWRELIESSLVARHSNRDLQIRRDVVDAMFVLLEEQSRTVRVIDTYLSETLLRPDSILSDLQQDLWKVGLIPDENLVSASISGRVLNNLALIEDCLEDSEAGEKLREKLLKSADPRVKHFSEFIRTLSPSDLALSDLKSVQDAIRSKIDPPPKKVGVPTLMEVLSNAEVPRVELLEAVANLAPDFLAPDFEDRQSIDITVKSPVAARVVIQGGRDQTGSWLFRTLDPSNLDTSPENQIFTILRLSDLEGRTADQPFSLAYLVEALAGKVEARILDEFVKSRAQMLRTSYFLGSDDIDSFTFLVAFPEALAVAEKYVLSWQRLLQSFADCNEFEGKPNLGAFLALGDAIWSRHLNSHETFENSVVNLADQYFRSNLACFHAWRLDPLVILAQQVKDRIPIDQSVASAASWAIDRAVPTFRVLRIGPNSLSYTTSNGGSCEFTLEAEDSLPPTSSKVPELRRSISAYFRTHPWARAGATIVMANPPGGGYLKNSIEMLGTALDQDPQIFVVRENSSKGVDRTIESTDFVEIVDTDDLINSPSFADYGRDLTILFLAGLRGRSQSMASGTYGPVDLVLANLGLGKKGAVSVPRINLRPDERNATIALLHQVGGVNGVTAAVFDLALPPAVLDSIPSAATGTEWLVIAAPAFVSSFPVSDLSDRSFHLLSEFDDGNYRFFVYARSIEPLGEEVRKRMSELPITSPRMAEVRELINKFSEILPQKVFDIALNRFGTEEALGLINARAIAGTYSFDDDLTLEISLDHAGWTQQLVGDENRRADLLVVRISSDPEATVPVRITVVEAKATSDPFFSPNQAREPFTEAIGQTDATREFLTRVFASAEEGLLESIQLRALIEQLASRAASEYAASNELDRDNNFQNYFKHISALSSPGRQLPLIDSLAIVTFLDGIQDLQIREEGDLRMVSASSKLLEQVLRNETVLLPNPITTIGTETAPEMVSNSNHQEEAGRQDSHIPESIKHELNTANEYRRNAENIVEPTSDDVKDLVDRVTRALRLRSDKVGNAHEATTSVGPTFVAVSLPFERGASLAPLQRSELDVSRDLGTSSVEIDNDVQIGRIRILVPRPDRVFPELPVGDRPPFENSQYLPLLIGKDLGGNDFYSSISTWPHALVAGSTGSGKTTFLRSVLSQLDRWGPNRANVVIVDGKGETDYFGAVSNQMFLPEFPEPQLSAENAVEVLNWLTQHEVPRRKKVMLDLARLQTSRTDAKSLYLHSLTTNEESPLCPLVVVIDEFNEIMIRGGSSKEQFVTGVTSVAQTARSVLVHLILATQRPDRTVVPGSIKANLPARFAFRLPTASDSVTVLGHGGAEKLLGWGDLLLQVNGEPDKRLQSYTLS